MTLPIRLHKRVPHDLQESHDWYERQRPGLGDALLEAVKQTLDAVQEQPEHFGLVHRTVRAAQVQIFPYIVYFQVTSNHIFILAVLHGRRSAAAWKLRLT